MLTTIYSYIDKLFSPLLSISPIISIILVAFFAALIMTLVYKWLTDQALMRVLKDDLKKYQQELKLNKDNTDKVLELNKKLMDVNLQYMSHSMKPTIVTMLPVLLIFGWLSAHFAYEPLHPGTEYNLVVYGKDNATGNFALESNPSLVIDQAEKSFADGKAEWKIKGKEGEYLLTVKSDVNSYNKDLIISNTQKYSESEKNVNDGVIDKISVEMKPLIVMNLFGWELGWLGTYIIFSLIFSMGLRKIMDLQ